MLRWQTAGESHGEALVAMIEGLPAGVRISTDDIVPHWHAVDLDMVAVPA